MTKGEQALKYLGIGWSVIPVNTKKIPLIDWKKYTEKKAKPERVQEWWDKWPDANIGIVTGAVSNLTVVDVDDGADYKIFPRTRTAKTGNNGFHLYYRYHKDFRNKAGIMKNVDIRGDGGYVVAPGSIHENGNTYEFIDNADEAPFPISMFSEQKKTLEWDKIMEGTGEGGRNQTATLVIGKLLKAFPTNQWETTVWTMVKQWNQKNNPPLPVEELETTFKSIASRELPQRNMQDEKADEMLHADEVADMENAELGKQERYSTGFREFDDILEGGFGQGDLIVVGGKTGMGKTTFAQTVGYHMNKQGIYQTWFSYELPIRDLWKKFQDMGVKKGFKAIVPRINRSGNIDWLEGRIIESIAKYGTKVVFIDHLGFLTPKQIKDTMDISSNYSVHLGLICRQLKSLAMEKQIVIVLLAHVRKTREELDTDDLAHSSGIAQEADLVLMVERQKKAAVKKDGKNDYGKVEANTGDVYSNFTKLSIVKNRRTGQNKFIKTELKFGKLQMIGEDFEQDSETEGQEEFPWEK